MSLEHYGVISYDTKIREESDNISSSRLLFQDFYFGITSAAAVI